ncbi:MAG: PD40 domain-containing protein [Candidatus Schekmanbacteria bacterium]|nr:PD40 domain-containing protein [Candidatus Schekmanbacteria bacterium]
MPIPGRAHECVLVFLSLSAVLPWTAGCDELTSQAEVGYSYDCPVARHDRWDAHPPHTSVDDWSDPLRLIAPLNSPCPEDSIKIAPNGLDLYFTFSTDLLQNLAQDEVMAAPTGTYRARRLGGPEFFGEVAFYDLGKGANRSADGSLSFSPDGRLVFFQSLRDGNLGFQAGAAAAENLDIYASDLLDGTPGPARNLGFPVNSEFLDGDEEIHPDNRSLYFTSSRPGGVGGKDIWCSQWRGNGWSPPETVGAPLNSELDDTQPTFSADGNTMFFASTRAEWLGPAIYRSERQADDTWGEPELVIRGHVGSPSLTSDDRFMYFVHYLADAGGSFDVDVWYSVRQP